MISDYRIKPHQGAFHAVPLFSPTGRFAREFSDYPDFSSWPPIHSPPPILRFFPLLYFLFIKIIHLFLKCQKVLNEGMRSLAPRSTLLVHSELTFLAVVFVCLNNKYTLLLAISWCVYQIVINPICYYTRIYSCIPPALLPHATIGKTTDLVYCLHD